MENQPHSNIDYHEVAKFDAMAQDWWDPDGPCAPLHRLNPLRVDWIKKQVNNLNQKSVIDVGCGGGLLSEGLAPYCLQMTAIDGSAQAIEIAKHHATAYEQTIDYQVSTAEAFANQHPHVFDLVCCLELIEHVPNPQSLIDALAKLVKPGGMVVLSTINRTPQAYLTAILGAEYILKMLPKGTHDFKQFIRPSELVQAARSSYLALNTLQGVAYQPLTQQFTLSKKMSVNYMASFIKE